jgi:translation initiation factor eIF-2B subunit alpha
MMHPFPAAGGGKATDMVVREFHEALARSPETAVAVAAIKVSGLLGPAAMHEVTAALLSCWTWFLISCAQALTSVVERSQATTMMGLEKELKEAAHSLERHAPACLHARMHA